MFYIMKRIGKNQIFITIIEFLQVSYTLSHTTFANELEQKEVCTQSYSHSGFLPSELVCVLAMKQKNKLLHHLKQIQQLCLIWDYYVSFKYSEM